MPPRRAISATVASVSWRSPGTIDREFACEAMIGERVAEAVKGCAVVYHLAGKLFMPGVPAADYYKTHVEGTRTLLSVCRERPRLERFVHCSTTGVLGATGDHAADESAPYRPTNAYEETKAQAELLVRAIGFPAKTVGRSFGIETGFIALQGTIIGASLALLTLYTLVSRSDAMGDGTFSVPWLPLVVLLVGTVGASLVATVAPAVSASRIRPAVALRTTD